MDFARILLVVASLAFLTASAADHGYQPRPLPAKDGKVGATWMKDLDAYHRVTMEETYLKLGHRDPRWDEQVLSFLRTWKGVSSGTLKQVVSNQELLAAADAVLATGCDDPHVRYLRARSLADLGRLEEALAQYRLVLPILRGKRYAPDIKAWCSWRVFDAVATLNKGHTDNLPADRDELLRVAYPAAVRHATAMLNDPLLAARPDYCLHQLTQLFSKYDSLQETFWAEVTLGAERPQVDPWLSLMVRGINEKNLAWKSRGGKWGHEVGPEQWKGFTEHLALARRHLSDAHALRPDLPVAATEMIAIAMADDRDDPRRWFDLAVAAQFDHKPAYEAMIWALMPRWRGSHARMDAFGRECLATARFDTEVTTQYFEVWKTIINRDGNKDPSLWRADPQVFANLEKLYAGKIDAQPAHRKWWLGQWCVAAIACQQKTRALALQAQLGGEIDPRLYGLFYLERAEAERRLAEWRKQEPIP